MDQGRAGAGPFPAQWREPGTWASVSPLWPPPCRSALFQREKSLRAPTGQRTSQELLPCPALPCRGTARPGAQTMADGQWGCSLGPGSLRWGAESRGRRAGLMPTVHRPCCLSRKDLRPCRGHRPDPWPGKTPHAAGQLHPSLLWELVCPESASQ